MKSFKIHEDICRAVKFHPSLPIFVSGGDDMKATVFHFEKGKEICSFNAHSDTIRSLEFHPRFPWVVSASDDMTARIWNWQSADSELTITGHTDYVMCAKFHPTEDHLLFTGSLDATVRLWDITNLIKSHTEFDAARHQKKIDLFAMPKFVYKYSMRHSRGVNWFSLSSDGLLYAVDDNHATKIWRYRDESAHEVDTLFHHKKSITCIATLSQHGDLFVTCSEDGSLCLWDSERRTVIKSFNLNFNNLWHIVSHPNKNILALAHDMGFCVFKLYRERPSFTVVPRALSEQRSKSSSTKGSQSKQQQQIDHLIYFIHHKSLYEYSAVKDTSKVVCKLKLRA